MAPRYWVTAALRFDMMFSYHFWKRWNSPIFHCILYHNAVSNPTRRTQHFLRLVIFTEDILLCLLLHKLHLFILTQQRHILIQSVLLHVCYIFRPDLGLSMGTSIQQTLQREIQEGSKGPLRFLSHYLCNTLKHKI